MRDAKVEVVHRQNPPVVRLIDVAELYQTGVQREDYPFFRSSKEGIKPGEALQWAGLPGVGVIARGWGRPRCFPMMP